MVSKIISFVLILFSIESVNAAIIPNNKINFCARFDQDETLKALASSEENLISFKNQGGLFNAGVCWWHSRFQRNLIYLTIFKPELPRPKKSEVKALINEIRQAMSVVVIPGFTNVQEFTEVYRLDIVKELENWQLYDGIILSAWIKGIQGTTRIDKNILKNNLDQLYDYVEIKKKIAYQKLQIKGITAHSWLVVGMKKQNNGYAIGIIDSNTPRMSTQYNYQYGNVTFYDKDYGYFVPYLEFVREEERITAIAKKFCNKKVALLTEDEYDYQTDLDIHEHNQIY